MKKICLLVLMMSLISFAAFSADEPESFSYNFELGSSYEALLSLQAWVLLKRCKSLGDCPEERIMHGLF